MKRLLMIIPIVLLYSCGVYNTPIQDNLKLLNSDTLELVYQNEIVKIPLKDGDAYYSYEFNIPNIGADTLYSVSRLVMPDIFNSAESVIQMEDFNLKTIVGKGLQVQNYPLGYNSDVTHNVYYTLRIQCYNEKIKISLYNLHSQVPYSSRYTYYITDAVTKGVNNKRDILENGYGALIFAIDDTGRGIINIFVNTAEKYLKENFNI